ncbi:hypothetical protein NA57DRAFT_24843, partial [Rhizodiscina lignyota]
MIWYLLYPFRGTTEPPVLSAQHPIRWSFHRLGTLVARHWLASIIFSVAVAVSLCYPCVFLYSNPAAGFGSGIPHHVWASARLFENATEVTPDVEVRQVWVHGNYMGAVKQDVLLEALEIQNALIRTGFGTPKQRGVSEVQATDDELADLADGFTACGYVPTDPLTWGFHSPLIYWNCSSKLVESDRDLLKTINEQAHRKSYMNLTLRPTSVFAGKSFVKNNISAADALVVTLFDLAGSDAGLEWDRRLQILSSETPSRRQWYLPYGRSQLYEFEFKQMSWNDGVVLLLCYTLMAFYVIWSLRKTRAVKSTLGLGITILTELTVYPFVVLTIGLENMFRLMNEVVSTPATMPTVQRIANSLGNVGHLSLAVAAQNLFLLWFLSKLVAPSVVAFCAFAAIALIVDFLFHLVFFVAVLSVDVQRLELQDSLDRINISTKRTKSPLRPERQTWTRALRQGRLPITTRVAGTAVSVCFVMALNWHFFDNMTLLQMLRSLRFGRMEQQNYFFSSASLPPINQRRTPAAWLRMQDHHTAEEVIQFVKPKAPSFLARIHQPVAVVLSGSDRSGAPERSESMVLLIHDILDEHLIPFALTIVVIVALTTILMNYLLWNELTEIDEEDEDEQEELLHVGRLSRVHEHDIIKISPKGRHCVTISSDRIAAVHVFDIRKVTYVTHLIRTASLAAPLWPIVSVALSDSAEWLALFAKDGRIGLWNIAQRRFSNIVETSLKDQSTSLFSFLPHQSEELSLVILTSDGWLAEITINAHVSISSLRILEDSIAYACFISDHKQQLRIACSTKSGSALLLQKDSSRHWITEDLYELVHEPINTRNPVIKTLLRIPSLGLFASAGNRTVRFYDASTYAIAGEVTVLPLMRKGSLRVLHSIRRECPSCRSLAVHSLALVYADAETEDCVMRKYTLDREATSLICLSVPDARKSNCNTLYDALPQMQIVENPGTWDVTGVEAVIGIRKSEATKAAYNDAEGDIAISSASDANRRSPNQHFRRGSRARARRQARLSARSRSSRVESPPTPQTDVDNSALEDWELWMLSTSSELHTQPLPSTITTCQPVGFGHREHEQLYAVSPGPVKKLGKRSVAIALANTLLTVTVG